MASEDNKNLSLIRLDVGWTRDVYLLPEYTFGTYVLVLYGTAGLTLTIRVNVKLFYV